VAPHDATARGLLDHWGRITRAPHHQRGGGGSIGGF